MAPEAAPVLPMGLLKLAGGGVITGFFVPAGRAKIIRNDVQSPSTWLRTFLDGMFSRISCAHFGVAITRDNKQITPSTKQIFSFDPLRMFMPNRTPPALDELFLRKPLGQETSQQCWQCSSHRATLQDGAKMKQAKTNTSANARMDHMIVQASCTNDLVKLMFDLSTHWTAWLDMSDHAERRVSKAHWQQFAWAALKKVGDFRTVEEARSEILGPARTRLNALWSGLDLMDKWRLSGVIHNLANGALYWDDDPQTCLQLFTLRKLMLIQLSKDLESIDSATSRRLALHGTLGEAGLRIYCEFWRKSVTCDSLSQLSSILNIYSDQIGWFSQVQFFDVMGIGYRVEKDCVEGKLDAAERWHRHALMIANSQANKEQPILEARIRSNLARTLFLKSLEGEAFEEACNAKQIIDAHARERGTHLREETIYHVNTTYLMLNLIRSKGEMHQNAILELSRAAMAEMEGLYGPDAKLVKKYQQELDNMIKSPRSFALVP